MLLCPSERHAGHFIRLRHRTVRELQMAGHPVWHHTGDLVRPGHIGDTRIAFVPVAIRQEGRSGKIVVAVARQRIRHRLRAGKFADPSRRGKEA